MKGFVLFLLTFLSFQAFTNVDVSLQSPLIQETQAGTIVTASFFVRNNTSEDANFVPTLELPEGWITLPFDEPFFF